MQSAEDTALPRIEDLRAEAETAPDLAARRQAGRATPDGDQTESAVTSIRRLSGDPKLEVSFASSENDPYADEPDRRLDVYADMLGFEYRVDPQTGTVIQMGRREDSHQTPHQTGPETRLSVAELREAALDVVERQIPGFRRLLSSLHPLEANDRREVYYFRWEDITEPLSETELPPFVQVGLFPDGGVASFTDTLTRTARAVPADREECAYPPSSWTKA